MFGHKKTQNVENEKHKPEDEQLAHRMQDIQFKLLVLSGKGGVGKSTVAANLAMAFAARQKRVGLLDVDIHGPSIPTLMGLLQGRLNSDGEEILPIALSEYLKVVSIGFLLPSNTDAVIWRGPRKYQVIRQFLSDVRWGALDYLVVDSPPGTGDEPLSVAQMVGSPCGAVVVTTPQDVAVNDVRRCVTFCETVLVPVLGIIENMSGFVCPHCGERVDLFKRGGGERLAEEMDVPFLGSIPIEPQIAVSGDAGTPFVQTNQDHPVAAVFQKIIENIIESIVTNTKV